MGDADSGITGVIAKGADGNIQFNAKKALFLPRAITRTTTR